MNLFRKPQTYVWTLIFLISFGLFVVQVYGIYSKPISNLASGDVPGYNIQIYSNSQFNEFLKASKDKNKNFEWLVDINTIVFGHLVHSDAVELRFENNWVLWLLSRWKGRTLMFTQDPNRIIQSESAICSQAARVLQSLAMNNNLQSRFISFDGHVVVEVMIDGNWFVADPDFGVVYPFSASDLVDRVNNGYKPDLLRMGYQAEQLSNYLSIIKKGVLRTHSIGVPHEEKPWFIERASHLLSWIFPIFGLILSARFIFLNKNNFRLS